MNNHNRIHTWYNRMWNGWDQSVFPVILDPAVTFRGSLGQVKSGYAGLAEYMDFVRAAFPDFHNQIEEIISERERSFARLTYTGTHAGPIFGIQPTNQKVSYAGAAVFHFAGGKIKDVWVLGDIYGLINQLKGQPGS